MKKRNLKSSLKNYMIAITAVYIIFIYLFSININPLYESGIVFWTTYLFLMGICLCIQTLIKAPKIVKSYTVNGQTYSYNTPKISIKEKAFRFSLVLMIAPSLIYILLAILSSPLFGSKAYANQLG
jgi:hypothetical protein